MSSINIHLLYKNGTIGKYDSTRNAKAYCYSIWRVLSKRWGFGDIFIWSPNEDKEAQKKFWSSYDRLDLPFYERVVMVTSWDLPYFTKDKICSVVECLTEYWKSLEILVDPGWEDTIPRVARILEELAQDQKILERIDGFFLSTSHTEEFLAPPEITEELKPNEDEEYRYLTYQKKEMTIEYLKNHYNKFSDGNKVFEYQDVEEETN